MLVARPFAFRSCLSISQCVRGARFAASQSRLPVAMNLFNSFAVETNGEVTLSPDNLTVLLSSMGIHPSPEKLAAMVDKADTNKDGKLQLSEFLDAYQWLLSQDQEEADLWSIFSLLDQDKSGWITPNELLGLTTTTRKPISSTEINRFFTNVGTKDDKIFFEQFKAFMENNKVLGWRILTSYRVAFIVGGPGSGKGTICAKLMEQSPAKLRHISSGELLRAEVETGSPLGKRIQQVMKNGQLCDGNTVIALLEKELTKSAGYTVLLDGFPRSVDHAKAFDELFGTGEMMIFFDCSDEIMLERILARAASSGRADDNEATARKRIATFNAQSKAPMAYFLEKGAKHIRLDTTLPVEQNVSKLLALPLFSLKPASE